MSVEQFNTFIFFFPLFYIKVGQKNLTVAVRHHFLFLNLFFRYIRALNGSHMVLHTREKAGHINARANPASVHSGGGLKREKGALLLN